MTEDDARLSEEEANVNDNMNKEERDILKRFERDELRPAPGVEREIETARRVARRRFQPVDVPPGPGHDAESG